VKGVAGDQLLDALADGQVRSDDDAFEAAITLKREDEEDPPL
jgi:hypothetical protein